MLNVDTSSLNKRTCKTVPQQKFTLLMYMNAKKNSS